MAWPEASDYVEALQNPRTAFSDTDLKNSTVAVNRLGFPKPITGNFAIVFEIGNGHRKWAVRCFLREVQDQEHRYAEIAQHLRKIKLDSAVDFQFLTQGIRVKGKWYPIVKMEWIQGARLDEYVRDNLNNSPALKMLVENWVSLTKHLKSSGIAHGDLQHGNVIITNSVQIKIIDYDGMYVPSLTNQKSTESGHRNYQHPSRKNDAAITSANYLNLDNFSSWVIAISLILLSLDPTLWQLTQAGDENLLFREVDFKQSSTKTWQMLTNHANRRVRELGRTFAGLCQISSFLSVPPLDSDFQQISAASQDSLGGAWLKDHLTYVQTPGQNSRGNHWILDYVADHRPRSRTFPDSFILEERKKIQQVFQKLPMLERMRFLFQWQKYVPIYLSHQYEKYGFVIKKRRMEVEKESLESKRLAIEYRLQAAQAKLANIDEKRRWRDATQKQIDFLKSELQSLSIEVAAYDGQERAEIANHIRFELGRHKIAPGKIPGIGQVRVSALEAIGIDSAADITPTNQPKIIATLRNIYRYVPDEDWRELMNWRKKLESQISTSAIKYKYQTVRSRALQAQAEKQRRLAELEKTAWPSVSFDAEYSQALSQVRQIERERDEIDEKLEQLVSELKSYDNLAVNNLISKLLE